MPDFGVVDEWYDLDGLRTCVTADEHVLLVATTDDGLRGFVHAGPDPGADDPGQFRLACLYVLPAHWGRGIGSSLLSMATERIRDAGATTLRLAALAENDVGVRFWEGQEFERVRERPSDELDVTEVVYEKSIGE
jgi:ribosomal protein S18 acetylase RimI-like enzyme